MCHLKFFQVKTVYYMYVLQCGTIGFQLSSLLSLRIFFSWSCYGHCCGYHGAKVWQLPWRPICQINLTVFKTKSTCLSGGQILYADDFFINKWHSIYILGSDWRELNYQTLLCQLLYWATLAVLELISSGSTQKLYHRLEIQHF